jgi:hypothetical protein
MLTTIKAYLSAFIAALVAMAGAVLYWRGGKDADAKHDTQEWNEYVNTRKRMDETNGPSDSDVQRWLHERGQHKRDL